MKNSIQHNKVLILGAICVSIIAGVLSYKLADYKNKQDLRNPKKLAGIFNITPDLTSESIQNALNNTDQASTSPEDDPFTITDKDTVTSRLAKQIYSDYINQEAGNSDLTYDDIAQNALSHISASDMPLAKHGLGEIVFTDQSNPSDIRAYGNSFAEIYMRNINIIYNNQQKYSKDLLALASIYENISRELVKLKVPVQIATTHLAIVNDYQTMADSFRLIDKQSTDPVKALLGIRSAKNATDDNDQMFINIDNYFKNNDIIFGNNEAGKIWN